MVRIFSLKASAIIRLLDGTYELTVVTLSSKSQSKQLAWLTIIFVPFFLADRHDGAVIFPSPANVMTFGKYDQFSDLPESADAPLCVTRAGFVSRRRSCWIVLTT